MRMHPQAQRLGWLTAAMCTVITSCMGLAWAAQEGQVRVPSRVVPVRWRLAVLRPAPP